MAKDPLMLAQGLWTDLEVLRTHASAEGDGVLGVLLHRMQDDMGVILEALNADSRESHYRSWLDALKSRMCAMANGGLLPDEKEAYRRAGKIPAIKLVRERSNLGLKEAKDLVEQNLVEQEDDW